MAITYQQISKLSSQIAEERGEWCGAPVPIAEYPLAIAEGYGIPTLNGATLGDDDTGDDDTREKVEAILDAVTDGLIEINEWHCRQRGANRYAAPAYRRTSRDSA